MNILERWDKIKTNSLATWRRDADFLRTPQGEYDYMLPVPTDKMQAKKLIEDLRADPTRTWQVKTFECGHAAIELSKMDLDTYQELGLPVQIVCLECGEPNARRNMLRVAERVMLEQRKHLGLTL